MPELPKTVHPVKQNLGQGGVYVWAGFLSADVTWIKAKKTLKLKVRTQMIGSGRPEEVRVLAPSTDGPAGAATSCALVCGSA